MTSNHKQNLCFLAATMAGAATSALLQMAVEAAPQPPAARESSAQPSTTASAARQLKLPPDQNRLLPAGQSQSLKSTSAQRPYIGVAVRDIGAEQQKKLGLIDRRGAYVFSMDKSSTAARAGILIGDVIRMIDGKVIKTMHNVVEHIGTKPVGTTVNIVVLRNGVSRKAFYVKVGSRPADRPVAEPDKNAEKRWQELRARSDRMRPARLDKVKLLRAKWRPWAIRHKDLLKAMLTARAGDEAALQAVIDAIPANPGSKGLGISRKDLMPTGDIEAAMLAGTPVFTWQVPGNYKVPANFDPKKREEYARWMRVMKARVSNNFAYYRDVELSTSMSYSRAKLTLWASGRVTESEPHGPQREIMPRFDFLKNHKPRA